MANPTGPRHNKLKTFCPACKRRGVITLKLPIGVTVCVPCLKLRHPTAYINLSNWVKDHPPIEQEEPPPNP